MVSSWSVIEWYRAACTKGAIVNWKKLDAWWPACSYSTLSESEMPYELGDSGMLFAAQSNLRAWEKVENGQTSMEFKGGALEFPGVFGGLTN
jgi:hypothetical protein